MKVAKWIMRAIVVLVVGVMLTAVIISAGLGRQARMTMKEEKKAKAKNSYTEKEMTITEKFRDINIQVADDMDVKLVESDDDKCHVTYFDSPDVIHSVTVQDDALVMTCADNIWFRHGLWRRSLCRGEYTGGRVWRYIHDLEDGNSGVQCADILWDI